MPPKKQPPVQQTAIGDDNIQVVGDGNVVNKTVNRTIIQKIYQFFAGDAETVDQRNRRIMLGHVENFWVKGILEKSLHGAALLELGIKEDPDALNYPWAIKREANKETLPADKSMLEIFQEIGMGRSLLILGAPGSGKTTMLLELTRQLIERAREDVTEPIPVVFNLSSWTEKFTLSDWLVSELNTIYYVPKEIAPTWVKENKILLLLDGLDEVRQESRNKCVNVINRFRKENGLTSIAVCSRVQDYAELKTPLAFDGAIEIQPFTSDQVGQYFERYGDQLTGISQVLEKDTVLREMAETPLFLSIMTFAYRDKQSGDIQVSENIELQRKHLFNTYITRMLEHPIRTVNPSFSNQQTLYYLHWLADTMSKQNIVNYYLEAMQPSWLENRRQERTYRLGVGLGVALFAWLILGLPVVFSRILGQSINPIPIFWLIVGLIGVGLGCAVSVWASKRIIMVDRLKWSWKEIWGGLRFGMLIGLVFVLSDVLTGQIRVTRDLSDGVLFGMASVLISVLVGGLTSKQIEETTYPAQRLQQTLYNCLFSMLIAGVGSALIIGLTFGLPLGLYYGLDFVQEIVLGLGMLFGLIGGLIGGLRGGSNSLIQHYSLRLVLTQQHLLPRQLIPFLEYCTSLIFLRRVGGGYIFVHRLLMDHFAAMYSEENE